MKSKVIKLNNRKEIDDSLRVSDYVRDQLSQTEKTQFENSLTSDKALQQALSEELKLNSLINQEQDMEFVSEQAFEDFTQKVDSLDRPKSSYFFFGIAASMALVALVVFNFVEQTNPDFETLSVNSQVTDFENRYKMITSSSLNEDAINKLVDKLELTLIEYNSSTNELIVESKYKLTDKTRESILQEAEVVFFEPHLIEPR